MAEQNSTQIEKQIPVEVYLALDALRMKILGVMGLLSCMVKAAPASVRKRDPEFGGACEAVYGLLDDVADALGPDAFIGKARKIAAKDEVA